MEGIEAKIGRELRKRGWRFAVAESCTGGLIANRITNISGSSQYFDRAIVTYSNKSKTAELGVDKELIKKHGAVSSRVAIAMAKGMLKKSCSNIAIAVTGIAGPTGGTKKKPVGLAYIAVAQGKKVKCIEQRFIGNRTDVKYQASTAALDLLRKAL